MKALFLLLIPLTSISQMPMKDGKVIYEMIDSSVTGTPQQLQVKAKMWMANTFNDSKAVIEVDDKDAGEVVGKGNAAWGSLPPYTGYFTIRISCKENKYRCQIYDLFLKGGTEGDRRSVERWIDRPTIGTKKHLGIFDKKMLSLLDDLKIAMAKADDNF